VVAVGGIALPEFKEPILEFTKFRIRLGIEGSVISVVVADGVYTEYGVGNRRC